MKFFKQINLSQMIQNVYSARNSKGNRCEMVSRLFLYSAITFSLKATASPNFSAYLIIFECLVLKKVFNPKLYFEIDWQIFILLNRYSIHTYIGLFITLEMLGWYMIKNGNLLPLLAFVENYLSYFWEGIKSSIWGLI